MHFGRPKPQIFYDTSHWASDQIKMVLSGIFLLRPTLKKITSVTIVS